MSKAVTCLEPKAVWSYFNEITKIPRPSSHEEKIAEFILKFAKEHGFKSHKDEVGNIIIDIEATEDKKDAHFPLEAVHFEHRHCFQQRLVQYQIKLLELLAF